MIGFDTNIILRAMLDDDKTQSPQAKDKLSSLGADQLGFISAGVLFELFWVLESRYRLPRKAIAGVFHKLIEAAWLKFEHFDALAEALHQYETGSADFSDAFIAEIGRATGCSATYTFDRHAARTVPGMELLA